MEVAELSANDPKNKNTDSEERAKIGRRVVYFALGVIGILGLAAIAVAIYAPAGESIEKSKQRYELVKDVLTSLLPVLGTWVGTVLAFYFSKENFVEAAKQTSELVRQLTLDQKLQEIPVVDAMISMTDPNAIKFILDRPEDKINLKTDILDLLSKSGKNRLPFIDTNGIVKYIIHRSIIDKYISEYALSGAIKPIDLTLKDLLCIDQYKQISSSFGTVGRDAKLNAVKNLIDGNLGCSDVFVTEDGTKSCKAFGWVTNVILTEKCRV